MEFKDYRIGWICALPTETAAVVCLLDEQYPSLAQPPHDHNVYTLGRIGLHNVVIACLPAGDLGSTSVAQVATRMRATFTRLDFCLMVGIGGGAPSPSRDIRLGDIVVSQPAGKSPGVVQYDFGKTIQEGRFCRTGTLNRPPDILLNSVNALRARHMYQQSRIGDILADATAKYPQRTAASTYPGTANDRLFRAAYNHVGGPNKLCPHCDDNCRVIRAMRTSTAPVVHYGPVASGSQIMRNAIVRDQLRQELGVLCFEMEAAGLVDDFPCLVIRGICDYADSHKNKSWQDYAASVAAAYAKELLSMLPAVQNQSYVGTPQGTSLRPSSISTRGSTIAKNNFVTTNPSMDNLSIRVLYEPKETAVADVVLVHGPFGVHGGVWQYCNKGEVQVLIRQLETKRISYLFYKPKPKYQTMSTERVVDWPKEFLPLKHPNIRILLIEYDQKRSYYFSEPDDLTECATNILYALARKRRKCSDRPIVYIAHGVGGILVKQAILKSQSLTPEDEVLQRCRNTRSVLFLGTPHFPTSKIEWLSTIQKVIKSTQSKPDKEPLEQLALQDVGCMEVLNQDFCRLANKIPIRIANFIESESQKQGTTIPVISATIGSADNVTDVFTGVSYGDICKFTDSGSEAYKKFDEAFEKCLQPTADPITSVSDNKSKLRSELSKILKYSNMTARQEQLDLSNVSSDTLEWVWSIDTGLQAWLEYGKDVFFISGKPASGKSTLVNHLCIHPQTRALLKQGSENEKWTILKFFFDFRAGKGLANSLEGLLRSLITQLLDNLSFDCLPDHVKASISTITNDQHQMRNLILDLLRGNQQFCVFIDGLDECEGDLLELVKYLKELHRRANHRDDDDPRPITLKLCLASRPDPAITVGLSNSPGFRMQEHNMPGLHRYTSLSLSRNLGEVGNDDDLLSFAREVASRAEGVFLWARFAMKEIIEGYTYGETWNELRARLKQLPRSLEKIYARILGGLESKQMSEASIMFVLVCGAKRPLSLYEFLVFSQIAISGLSQEKLLMKAASIERRIATKCGGLLEVTTSQRRGDPMTSKVKLIHATARNFLQSEQARQKIDDALQSATGCTSNTIWLKISSRYLDEICAKSHTFRRDSALLGPRQHGGNNRITGLDRHKSIASLRSHPKDLTSSAMKDNTSGLLQYTSLYLFDHARAAEREISSVESLAQLPFESVLSLHARCCEPCCPWCADLRLLQQFVKINTECVDDRCRAAMVHGLARYVQNALDCDRIDILNDDVLLLAIANCFRAHKTADVDTGPSISIVQSLLQAGALIRQKHMKLALRVGDSELLNLMFDFMGDNIWSRAGETPLYSLITQRYLGPSFRDTAKTLVLRGVDLDEICGHGASVFHAPLNLWKHEKQIKAQEEEVLISKPKILSESVAELQFLDSFEWGEDRRTRTLEEKCIQLLNQGASVDEPDTSFKPPLQVAWERVNTSGIAIDEHVAILQPVIRALLQFRARVSWQRGPRRPEVLAYTRLGLRDIAEVITSSAPQFTTIWQEKVDDKEKRYTHRVSGTYGGVLLPGAPLITRGYRRRAHRDSEYDDDDSFSYQSLSTLR